MRSAAALTICRRWSVSAALRSRNCDTTDGGAASGEPASNGGTVAYSIWSWIDRLCHFGAGELGGYGESEIDPRGDTAARTGFRDPERMRRAFIRAFGQPLRRAAQTGVASALRAG
jgi:AraC-like DNA-binding protein